MDRREFLRGGASTLLVLPLGTFLLQCGDDDDNTTPAPTPATTTNPTQPDTSPPDAPPRIEDGNIIYTSSRTNLHSHSFPIPTGTFGAPPPQGISGNTTIAQAHVHTLTLSQTDLQRAANGETVKVPTSTEVGHLHVFTIVRVG
jgi:hypothetical protein